MRGTDRMARGLSPGTVKVECDEAGARGGSRIRHAMALAAAMSALGAGSAAQAACSPANPAAGATVTCTGAANPLAPSYGSSANNLTVNVQPGAGAGVLLGLGGTALTLTGNNVTLSNAGTIDPSLLGLLSLLSSGTFVGNGNASTVSINNAATGVMNGTSGLLGVGISGVTGMALAVQNGTGGVATIRNDGTIGSNALLGISLIPSDAPVVASFGGGQTNFTNTGTITGRVAFQAAGTPSLGNTFANAGTINGGVSMGAASTNTFTAVSGSSVNLAGGIGLDLNVLNLVGVTLGFSPTGVVDGGAGGNNTLVLQNVLPSAGTGSGTGGAVTTLSSGTYTNFQHLDVNSGTWNLQGPLVSGDTTLDGGLVNFSNGGVFGTGTLTANGGAIAASTTGLTLGNDIALAGAGLSVAGTNPLTLSGAIGGGGSLQQNGTGTLTLSGANSYTGGTTVSAGVLQGNASSLQGDIVDNATLVFDQSGNGSFGGAISGSGDLVKQGAGVLTLTGSSSYTGSTQLDAGTLALGAGASIASSAGIGLAAGATLDLSAAGNQSLGPLNGAGGTVDLGANTLTIAGAGNGSFAGSISGSGALVKDGSGTQTLAGTNLYTGGTTVDDGTLALGAGGSLAAGSALALNGNGVLDVSAAGNQSIANLAGDGGRIQLGGTTLSVDAGSYGGVIAGTGGLTKTGNASLALNGINTYTGATQVSAGSLIVGADAAHAAASVQSDVTVANTGTLGGFGQVNGNVDVQAGGHLAPGNPVGSLTVNGNLLAEQGSQFDFAFGAPGPNFSTPGQGHSVQVNGDLTINGATLNPLDAGGFGPGLYNMFNYTGTLTEANGGIAPPAGGYTIQNLTGSKQINLIATSGMTIDFWNANGLASGAQMGGGSGVWSQANANWTDATGSVTTTREPANAFGIFGGAPGTVTVDNAGGTQPVTTLGMQFAADGYHLNGDALTMLGIAPDPLGEIRVGDGSPGSASWTATIDNALVGAGIDKTGLGTLVLNGANTYTQGTRISQGVLSVSSDANLGAASAGIDFEGGALRITGTAFNTTARTVTMGAAGATLDIADAGNDFTLASALGGAGGLTKQGAGTLVLSAANTYTGATDVSQGTLRAGAADAFSAASAHTVAAGAALDLAGHSQTLAGLANAGTVNLLSTVPGTTLTVTGPYVGHNGVLNLGTTLGATGSLSDRLVLSGPAATASGNTTLQITNLGGLGAQTTGNGIEVVSAQNGATSTATAFTLAGQHVDAGAFQYRLYAGDASGQGSSWFLSTQDRTIGAGGTGGGTGGSGGAGGTGATGGLQALLPAAPTYRAEVPLYAALPGVLRQSDLAMLGDLDSRTGDAGNVAGAATADSADASANGGWGRGRRRAWGRVLGGTTTIDQRGITQAESRTRMAGFQTGVDLFANSRWNAGVYAGVLRADADVDGAYGPGGLVGRAGTLRTDNTYVGGYARYAGPQQGPYADFVLQYGYHDVKPGGIAQGSGFSGTSVVASAEVGRCFALGGSGWAIEPQAQLIYQHLSLDDAALSGANVRQDADNAVIGRIGARIAGDLSTSMGRLKPYVGLNLWHGFSGQDTVTFAGPAGATPIASDVGYSSTELMVGFTLGITPKVSIYGQLGRLFRAGGGDAQVDSAAQGSLGVNVMF